MRIWSLHPQYLDSKGLVALWRETLLARHVLDGKTNGYRKHPQLRRFKELPKPVNAIDRYLFEVYNEAVRRGYNFDRKKFNRDFGPVSITVTQGQIAYETDHLLRKLSVRDLESYGFLKKAAPLPEPHPLFKIIPGDIEAWEIL